MNQWHNANEWPEDCKTVDSEIEVETITGKQLKCITRGWGFKENIPNENFVFGIIWVKRWRYIGKEKPIQNFKNLNGA